MYSKYIEEHIIHVDEILTALYKDIVALNISIFSFFSDTLEYLGHIILLGTLEVRQVNF